MDLVDLSDKLHNLEVDGFKGECVSIGEKEAIVSFSSYTGTISVRDIDRIKDAIVKCLGDEKLAVTLYLYDTKEGLIEFKIERW